MKNRKLFAIITLVAFMLTMMPLMAFADGDATTPVVPNITASGSSISVDKSTAKVFSESKFFADSTKDKVEALEFILDMDGKTNAGQYVVVFAERNGSLSDADTIFTTKPSDSNKTLDNKGYAVLESDKVAEKTVYVASNTAGTVTLKAYLVKNANYTSVEAVVADINRIYNGNNETIKTAFVGNGCTGKINAANSDVVVAPTVTLNGKGNALTPDATGTNKGAFTGVDANNGVDYYKVSTLVTKGNSKLVGEKVTISVDKDGATVNKEEATTSATGKVDFKVSASKPGTYTVTIESAGQSKDLKFYFGENRIDNVKITYTTQGTIAVDANETTALMLTAYDANGNALTANRALSAKVNDVYEIEITEAPADSSLEDETFDCDYQTKIADGLFVSFKPDAAGEYTFKVYNKTTGKAAYTTIKAAEFGTIDHATISYSADTFSLGAQTQAPTVYVYDQNGVKKQATSKKFSYTGLGVADFNGDGQLTFKNDSAYTGKQVVVSVVANGKYAASTTLTIGAEPAALKFTDATAEVGGEATVNAQVVDVNGNATAITANRNNSTNANGEVIGTALYDVTVDSAIITEKPEGANASVDASYFENSKDTFLKKGTGKVLISSNKEGTVKANVVIKLTPDNTGREGNEKLSVVYLTGVATATFGAKAPEKGDGATVTFIIGNTTFVANGETKTADVAPYVANGRTFIPVRAFAEATGAKVEYDAATQVITITGEGLSAQMTIGSNILTVNGQTTVMDTAAAVTAEGRTVLPVRFAGQALGYGFEVAYGANGAVSSVTMFK